MGVGSGSGSSTRVVVGITVERRFVYLPPGFALSSAYCEDDPSDCCVESGSDDSGSSGSGTGSGPTVEVACSPVPVPETLYLTYSGALAGHATLVLTWRGGTLWSSASEDDDPVCPGHHASLSCGGIPPEWGVAVGDASSVVVDSATSSPLHIEGSGISDGVSCNGAFTFTITETAP